MRAHDADDLGRRLAALVCAGRPGAALDLLAPVLQSRTPFAMTGRVGAALGAAPVEQVNPFLDQIAAGRTEGGWVVIGGALGRQLDRDPVGALARCHDFIVVAGAWYAADILGERVPGPALVAALAATLERLSPWRHDLNRWVRRTVGVAAHYWTKRSRGSGRFVADAETVLDFLAPMLGERDLDAVKGVGWALKTMGRYCPDLAADWLACRLSTQHPRPRALLLTKALTYLSAEQRLRVRAAAGGTAGTAHFNV